MLVALLSGSINRPVFMLRITLTALVAMKCSWISQVSSPGWTNGPYSLQT